MERPCKQAVLQTLREFRGLDILINYAAEQHPQDNFENISSDQLERTFRTDIFSFFYMDTGSAKALLCRKFHCEFNICDGLRGSSHLIDYSSTKGAIVAFTRSLGKALAQRNIRVNAVALGPIWTLFIPSTFSPEKVDQFGKDTAFAARASLGRSHPAMCFWPQTMALLHRAGTASQRRRNC